MKYKVVGKRKREKKIDSGEVQLKNIDKPSLKGQCVGVYVEDPL